MKKLAIITLLCLLAVVLVGCGSQTSEQVHDDNVQEQVQGETVADYYAVIQSLAGIWDFPGGAGNPVYISTDGAWEHSTGDTGLYGSASITEYNGDFSLEFIVTHAEGAGAFGWIPQGETSPAAGTEYGWRYGDVWGRVVYSPTLSELHLENWDGLMLLMERNR